MASKRKPAIEKVAGSLINKGDHVWSKSLHKEAEVTSITRHVVLHLDNGQDEVYTDDEKVERVK